MAHILQTRRSKAPEGRMSIEDLWYRNAVIYCLDLGKYQDANGDGIGDLEGLSRRLDYLAGIAEDLLRPRGL